MGGSCSSLCGSCPGCDGRVEEFDMEIESEKVAVPGADQTYLSQLAQATEHFLALVEVPDAGFQQFPTKDDVKVFCKDTEAGFVIRSEWKSAFPAEVFIKFLNNNEERQKWDKNLESIREIRRIDTETGLFYQTYKKVMLMSKRDLVYVTTRMKSGKAWVDVSTSVSHPDYPENPDFVRLNLTLGGYYAVPLEVAEGDYITRIVSVSECNFGGSVPKGVVKSVSVSAVPLFARDVAAALGKFLSKSS